MVLKECYISQINTQNLIYILHFLQKEDKRMTHIGKGSHRYIGIEYRNSVFTVEIFYVAIVFYMLPL